MAKDFHETPAPRPTAPAGGTDLRHCDRTVMPQAGGGAEIPVCRRSAAAGSPTAWKSCGGEARAAAGEPATWSFPAGRAAGPGGQAGPGRDDGRRVGRRHRSGGRRRRSPPTWPASAPACRSAPTGTRPPRGCSRLKRQLARRWTSTPTCSAIRPFPRRNWTGSGRGPGPLDPDPRRAGRAGRHGGQRTALRPGPSLRPAAVRQRQDAARASRARTSRQFYRRHIRPEEAGLIAVGDITHGGVDRRVGKGRWAIGSRRREPPRRRNFRRCRRRSRRRSC